MFNSENYTEIDLNFEVFFLGLKIYKFLGLFYAILCDQKSVITFFFNSGNRSCLLIIHLKKKNPKSGNRLQLSMDDVSFQYCQLPKLNIADVYLLFRII